MNIHCDLDITEIIILKKYNMDNKLIEIIFIKDGIIKERITDEEKLNAFA
jgi:hypothetical protein